MSKSKGEVHLFEVKWSNLSAEDAHRVAVSLKQKAMYLPSITNGVYPNTSPNG